MKLLSVLLKALTEEFSVLALVHRRFRRAMHALIERMSNNPLQFPTVFKNVRRALLRRFPYSLFFVVEDSALIVIACFHASRDPSHWQNRI